MADQWTARSADELLDRDQTLSMSGLDYMRGILEGRLPMPPISGLLNYRLTSVDPGRVVFSGAPTFSHCNPGGTVHGGWYGTLLDSAMACAVMTLVPRGSLYTTLEYKVNIVRPIPIDATIDAIGVAQHAGRSTGVATGEIRGSADGKLYATGSTTCLIMQVGAAGD